MWKENLGRTYVNLVVELKSQIYGNNLKSSFLEKNTDLKLFQLMNWKLSFTMSFHLMCLISSKHQPNGSWYLFLHTLFWMLHSHWQYFMESSKPKTPLHLALIEFCSISCNTFPSWSLTLLLHVLNELWRQYSLIPNSWLYFKVIPCL